MRTGGLLGAGEKGHPTTETSIPAPAASADRGRGAGEGAPHVLFPCSRLGAVVVGAGGP